MAATLDWATTQADGHLDRVTTFSEALTAKDWAAAQSALPNPLPRLTLFSFLTASAAIPVPDAALGDPHVRALLWNLIDYYGNWNDAGAAVGQQDIAAASVAATKAESGYVTIQNAVLGMTSSAWGCP